MRHDGVLERRATSAVRREAIRMRIVRHPRGRHHPDEIRLCLLVRVRVAVRELLRDEFLHAPMDGRRAGDEAAHPHHRENRALVHVRAERHRDDALAQLQDTRCALALAYLRSRDQVQGAREHSRDALPLVGIAVHQSVLLVSGWIHNVSVSNPAYRA